ncbi:MAG: SAM-dependent methyltransferase [Clostridia bacterium]|nr:SAM-dependent methyltransferase [Clostridia bacterium]
MNSSIHPPILDARLSTALDFVRPGAIVADIGTDHAYLPAALVLNGRARAAIAADINQGPLEHAAETIHRYHLQDRISLRLTDGLHGIEQDAPTDILIFGMGGELIAQILAEAPFVRNGEIRLILQPMTKQAELRQWLAAEGFNICGERLSLAAGKIYQTICAEYSGEPYTLDAFQAEFGEHILADRPPLLERLAKHKANVLRARIAGQTCAGEANAKDEAMLAATENLLKEFRERNED